MKEKPMSKGMEYKAYPAHDGYRGGARVCWYYYRDHEAAKVAAKAAKFNGQIQAGLGYDFGFCAPGAIQKMVVGEHAGMWEVCIP
jgi:hypothetical protein